MAGIIWVAARWRSETFFFAICWLIVIVFTWFGILRRLDTPRFVRRLTRRQWGFLRGSIYVALVGGFALGQATAWLHLGDPRLPIGLYAAAAFYLFAFAYLFGGFIVGRFIATGRGGRASSRLTRFYRADPEVPIGPGDPRGAEGPTG